MVTKNVSKMNKICFNIRLKEINKMNIFLKINELKSTSNCSLSIVILQISVLGHWHNQIYE